MVAGVGGALLRAVQEMPDRLATAAVVGGMINAPNNSMISVYVSAQNPLVASDDQKHGVPYHRVNDGRSDEKKENILGDGCELGCARLFRSGA